LIHNFVEGHLERNNIVLVIFRNKVKDGGDWRILRGMEENDLVGDVRIVDDSRLFINRFIIENRFVRRLCGVLEISIDGRNNKDAVIRRRGREEIGLRFEDSHRKRILRGRSCQRRGRIFLVFLEDHPGEENRSRQPQHINLFSILVFKTIPRLDVQHHSINNVLDKGMVGTRKKDPVHNFSLLVFEFDGLDAVLGLGPVGDTENILVV
jgi:hypothetical protein